MVAIQLYFALRTSFMIKTVSLLGSWDNYSSQLPLSQDRVSSPSSRTTNWQGHFRFQGNTLQRGKRYWYYYIIDGQQVSYDSQQYSVREPVTGRILNVLDIPLDGSFQNSASKTSSLRNSAFNSSLNNSKQRSLLDKNLLSQSRRRYSRESLSLKVDIPKGRPLSISQIKSPRPITPHAAKFILEAEYGSSSIQEITSLFSVSTIDSYQINHSKSPSSVSSSPSTCSSYSDQFDSDSPISTSSTSSFGDYSSSSPGSQFKCEHHGVTRRGERFKSDCCDAHCGYVYDVNPRCSSNYEIKTRATQRFRRPV
ncbi:hypothetical protein OnM2_103004 [Erysiphe neolycopersici]|uniref:Uncharacterized protein n=1 Tax=Erysiphe neolycopersici TaxID=212602 RepID=A0A420H881_9PEZI|nr:hypothetical protein OnM2_103004 [Erysiphe neolycopersici]